MSRLWRTTDGHWKVGQYSAEAESAIPDQYFEYPIIPDWLEIWCQYPNPIHTRTRTRSFFQYPNPIRPEVENTYPLDPGCYRGITITNVEQQGNNGAHFVVREAPQKIASPIFGHCPNGEGGLNPPRMVWGTFLEKNFPCSNGHFHDFGGVWTLARMVWGSYAVKIEVKMGICLC